MDTKHGASLCCGDWLLAQAQPGRCRGMMQTIGDIGTTRQQPDLDSPKESAHEFMLTTCTGNLLSVAFRRGLCERAEEGSISRIGRPTSTVTARELRCVCGGSLDVTVTSKEPACGAGLACFVQVAGHNTCIPKLLFINRNTLPDEGMDK
eukprot:1159201-Pelagomonas_calceolata.AAC.15